jgi:hypothetical protein
MKDGPRYMTWAKKSAYDGQGLVLCSDVTPYETILHTIATPHTTPLPLALFLHSAKLMIHSDPLQHLER